MRLRSRWRGQCSKPLCQLHMSCFRAVLFFYPPTAHLISVKCKHVQGRAGEWQGDWWRAAERPSVCMCVCVVFVWDGLWVGSPHHLKNPSICLCLVLSGNLPARCGATSLATPNSTIHAHATQPPLSLHITEPRHKQGSQMHEVLLWISCFRILLKSQEKTLIN